MILPPVRFCRLSARRCLGLLVAVCAAILGTSSVVAGMDQELSPADYPGHVLGHDSGYGTVMVTAGDWLAIGAPGIAITSTDTLPGQVFFWQRTPGAGTGPGSSPDWTLKQRLPWPDSPDGTGTGFGLKLAMSTSGNRLLVGSFILTSKVHVFSLVDGVWVLDGTLAAQGGIVVAAASGFGECVALSADGNTAVIGCPKGINNGESAASATGWLDVYTRESEGWTYHSRLSDPLHGADLGKSLTLHGNMILAGRPKAGGKGNVAVFEKSGNAWAQTRRIDYPGSRQTATFGSQVLADNGSLFVVDDSGVYSRFYEYSLSGNFDLLFNRDVSHMGSLLAVRGDHLAIGRQGTEDERLILFKRHPTQKWVSEGDILSSAYSFNRRSVAWCGDELLVGGDFSGPYPTDSPDSSGNEQDIILTNWTVRTAQLRRYYSYDRWDYQHQLQPMTQTRLDAGVFGQSTAGEGEWLAVGAPETDDTNILADGLVSLYQKGAGGSLQFHSHLPEPVGLGTCYPEFGSQVSLSGDRIAVGHVYDRLAYRDAVVVYAYDSAQDRWVQEAIIHRPEDPMGNTTGFGTSLSLKGDLLAVGAPQDGRVYLYRRTGTQWALEAELKAEPNADPLELEFESFGHSVSLSGTTVLVGAPAMLVQGGDAAYFFELKKGVWTRVARFAQPKSAPSYEDFATFVSLDGDRACIGRRASKSQGAMYQRTGGVWRLHMELPGWNYAYYPSAALSGSQFVNNSSSWGPELHTLVSGKWVHAYAAFASGMARGLTLADGMLIGGTTSSTPTVRVRNLHRQPDIQTYTDLPDTSVTTEGGQRQMEMGEYLVGSKTEEAVSIEITHQGVAPVRLTAALSGDVADFSLPATTWDLSLAKFVRTGLRFHPKTPGPKELTLRFTSDAPHDQPYTLVIRAQVVAQARPVTFLLHPNSQLTNNEWHFRPLIAHVDGTRPFTYRWLRNGAAFRSSAWYGTYVTYSGLYQLEVTNPAGKFRSETVALGRSRWVSENPSLRLQGQPMRFEVAAEGPGIKILWCKMDTAGNPQPLPEGGRITGTTKTVLNIRSASLEDSGTYVARVTLPKPDGSILVTEIAKSTTIVSAPVATLEMPDQHVLSTGVQTTLQCGFQFDRPDVYTPIYTVTGLPPGLTKFFGTISGKPAKAGVYRVSVTVKLGPFTSAPLVTQVVVKDRYLPNPGLYWGLIDPSADLPLGGAASVELRPNGTYTGTLHTGAQRTSFTSQFHDTATLAHRFPTGGTRRAFLTEEDDGAGIRFWVQPLSANSGNGQVPLTLMKLIRPLLTEVPPPELLGRHVFGLRAPDEQPGGNPTPWGTSFGTLTVAADRSVKLTAQLADGGTLTSSGWYGQALGTQPARLYLYAVDTSGKGSLRGTLAVPMGLPPGPETDPEGNPLGPPPPIPDHAIVHWTKVPVPGRTYPAGFEDLPLTWLTSRFNPQFYGQRFVSVGQKRVELFLPEHAYTFALPTDSGTSNTAGASGSTGTWTLKLTSVPSTGLFTGQLTFPWSDPADASGQTIATRTFTYKGAYLPEHRLGVGHFLLPSLPAASKTSPVYSGSVRIITPPDFVPGTGGVGSTGPGIGQP